MVTFILNLYKLLHLRIDPTPFRSDLQQWRERDVAATLNRNKQVEAANARVAALEGELAACQNKTAGLEEEAKGKHGKTQLTVEVLFRRQI